jgi:Na+/proline symporter
LDWAVLLGYLVVVSVLGVVLAGKQRDLRDFFRGGDQLPWYAVAGSMIATIISAVTFVAVPAVAFRAGGNFTYLQFGLIAGLLARLFVCFVLIPAYYRKRVFSPYDYIGQRLGEGGRSVTTALFTLLGLLGQSARLYLTAVVLDLVLGGPLQHLETHTGIDSILWALFIITVIAVAWTMLGGIATVVWTDALLFLVFVVGGLVALITVVMQLPGGWSQLIHDGVAAGKFQLLDLSTAFDVSKPYTLWAAIFAVTLSNIGSYGTDQLLAQRIFCCKSPNQARAAVMASWAGELVVALMLLVGVGLWAFYRQFPEKLTGAAAAMVAADSDKIFPVFILTIVKPGLTGLIIAGIFAAAISSLTSILAALAQTTLSAVVLPLGRIDPEGNHDERTQRLLVRTSRGLVVFWGVALMAAAAGVDGYIRGRAAAGLDTPLLDLALGMTNYVVGALLAAFLLAWLPLKINAFGLLWSAPLSVVTVFVVARTGAVAWPWYAPIGAAVAFSLGWLLAGRKDDHANPQA